MNLLIKKELQKIDLPEKLQEMNSQEKRWIVISKTAMVHMDKVLAVAFYQADTMMIRYVVYSDGCGFITWDVNEGKWTEKTMMKLTSVYFPYFLGEVERNSVYYDVSSADCASMFFSVTDPTVTALCKFQQGIRDRETKIRNDKKRAAVDAIMALIKNFPRSFEKWIDDVPFGSCRYIYYKRKDKRSFDGYCTACQTDMELKWAKHRKAGVCPNCGRKITFLAEGRATRISDYKTYSILQRVVGGFMLRHFWEIRSYMQDYRNPRQWRVEEYRFFFSDDLSNIHMFQSWENWCDYRPSSAWHERKWISTVPKDFLYTRNLTGILSDSPWKYSGLYDYAKRVGQFDTFAFLKEFPKKSCIEFLVKMKLDRLVRDAISSSDQTGNQFVDLTATTIKGVFKINWQDLPHICKMDMNLDEIDLLEYLRNKGKSLSETELHWIRHNLKGRYGVSNERIKEILEYMTPHKIIRYLTKQAIMLHVDVPDFSGLLIQWTDYIRNAIWLSHDIRKNTVLFPMDLIKFHDKYAAQRKREEVASQYGEIERIEAEINDQYQYETKTFLIRAPHEAVEIVDEGDVLQHCVDGYVGTMAEHDCVILFIRQIEDPDKPFYTLEVRNNEVQQVYGFKHALPTPEVNRFVTAWKNRKLRTKKQAA
jgi:predicted RNA-binding Zn-ribbon protein involved in translation (DUF1610 family)